jgi:hypothetical protein
MSGEAFASPLFFKNFKMTYEVKITTIDKNFTYVVKAENVLEAEEVALKELGKDIPKDYITAGQYSVEHIENLEATH